VKLVIILDVPSLSLFLCLLLSYVKLHSAKCKMSKIPSECELQSFMRQSAHRMIDERHSLSPNQRWDMERRFIALSDKDLLDGSKQEKAAAMSSLLDSLTGMCVCYRQRQPKQKRVYPVEGFSPHIPLDTTFVVKKRLEKLQKKHFFRPVSEDDLAEF
jgi:hypothetical protein